MYRKYRQGWMKHLDFMIIDMLCLQIAFILSYVIRHGLQNPYLDMDYRNLAIFIEVADIAIIYIFETFQDVLKRGYYQEFAVTLKHSILIMLVAVLFIFNPVCFNIVSYFTHLFHMCKELYGNRY